MSTNNSSSSSLDARILRVEARLMRRDADLQQRLMNISQRLRWRPKATRIAWGLGGAAGVVVLLRALRRRHKMKVVTSAGRTTDGAAARTDAADVAGQLPGLLQGALPFLPARWRAHPLMALAPLLLGAVSSLGIPLMRLLAPRQTSRSPAERRRRSAD